MKIQSSSLKFWLGTFLVAGLAATTSANAAPITWAGTDVTNPSFWDINTTLNWVDPSPVVFLDGDNVTFNDAGAVKSVSVRSVVAPGSVTFSNSSPSTYVIDDITVNVETVSAATGGLNVTGSGDVTMNVKITGNTNITHSGTGILGLGGGAVNNDFTGTITVNGGGTLKNLRNIDKINSLGAFTNTFSFTNGSTFDLNSTTANRDVQSYGTGSFVFGAGTFITNSGTTSNDAFSDELVFGGNITFEGAGRFDIDTISVTGTNIIITMLNDAGNVIKGDNSLQSIAEWRVNDGTLFSTNTNALGSAAVVTVNADGALRTNNGGLTAGGRIIPNNVTLNGGLIDCGPNTGHVGTLTGAITVTAASTISPSPGLSLTFTNAITDGATTGNVTLAARTTIFDSSINLSGFSGDFILSGNTVKLQLQNGVNVSQDIVVSDTGAHKEVDLLAGNSATISGNITVDETTVENFDFVVIDAADTLTVSGNISGSGAAGITKTNAGKLVLSGTNNYTGGTKIYAGTVLVNGNSSAATGAVSVGGPSTLGGTGTIGGAIDVAGTLAPGTSIGTLTTSGAITGNGTLQIEVNGTSADKLVVNGSIDIANLKLAISELSPLSGPVVIVDGSASATIDGAAFAAPLPAGYQVLYGYDDGSDTKNIAIAPAAGFSTWITGTFAGGATVPEGQRGANDDPDNDGISNLVEYAIEGEDPTVSNSNIGSFSGSTLSYTKSTTATGLTYALEFSTDLGIADSWEEIENVPGYVNYVNDATSISVSFTLTGASPPKNFVRLQVTED